MDKTGWTKVKLGDIATFTKGKNPKTYSDVGVGNPIVGAHEIECNTSEYEKYTCEELPKCVGTDVLILWDGSKAGKCGYGHSATLSSTIMKLTVKNTSIISSDYLYRAIGSIRKEIENTKHGAAIPHLDRKAIEQIEIDLPPMEIQLQIAKLLTTIDNIIQSKSAESTKYQNMKTQIMNDIFNNGEREQHWAKVKVKDIFKITRGYVLKASETAEESDDEYRYPVYSSQTKNEGLMGYYNEFLYENAITWTTDGAYAGTVKYRKGKFYCTNVCGVLLSDKYANKCIAEILNMNTQPYVVRTGNPKLMNNVMAEIEIPLPPMEIQLMIANLLTMYDDMIETVNKEKKDYEKIKIQMMNMIFA